MTEEPRRRSASAAIEAKLRAETWKARAGCVANLALAVLYLAAALAAGLLARAVWRLDP